MKEKDVIEMASRQHASFNRIYDQYRRCQKSKLNADDVIKRLCDLIYVLRCNLFHGLKTVQGLDIIAGERNKKVCETVAPILELIVDALFDYPKTRIIS